MVNEDRKQNIIYEAIANELDYESLPRSWQLQNIQFFSNKTLFDYQIDALKNITKFLKYFYEDIYEFPSKEGYENFIEAKKKFYNELLKRNKDVESLGISDDNKAVRNILQYYDYTIQNKRKVINFYNFVNRAGFWMATGSGKTLVIIKLIELLDYLMKNGKIPKNDILFLTYRDDLIEQFKKHVDEYNEYHNRKINIYDLRDYDKVKYGGVLINKEDINVFVYRSDLISEETKEKTLSYADFENNGKWYLILDEAHKGDKEDSKRQIYYSFITRFGFLFNFSATFTDPWDIVTTVFNFNLDRFIEKGYGKNVYVSQKNLDKFDEFDENEKEKVVLKSLILLTAIKKAKQNISSIEKDLYHNPMMVIYGNSVNTDESDLQLIFNILDRIATNSNLKNFNDAMNDLIDELNNHPRYVFGHDEFILNEQFIKSIDYNDILKYVYNSDTHGKIEAIKIPKNEEELALKLKTSDRPFALIKIGDIGKWIKEKLKNYEISESYDNQSIFNKLNEDKSSINILLGSRSFYEGWDSNRPNVMMFINIGKGDSKKYVLQSIGRGERIEPLRNMRKRLRFLANENALAKQLKNKLNDYEISLIESLFVFGTNVDNITKIMDSIKYERSKSGFILELKKNQDTENYKLLIPVYQEKDKPDINDIPKFSGNFDLLDAYMKWIGDDKILYALYSDYLYVADIPRLKEYLRKENFDIDQSGNAHLQTIDLIDHIKITLENFDRFKDLENEIIHFKEINAILDEKEVEELKMKIINVVGVGKQEEKLKQLTEKLRNGEISPEEFSKQIKKINWFEVQDFQKDNYKISIRNVSNHYYIPVIIAEDSKEDLINHIIKEKSEKEFIEDLENFIKNNQIDVDFWFFSKIDQTTDKVYIPYYNKRINKQDKFYPDFIFWIKKGNDYYIVFLDPKSTAFTDYEYKVDGYSKIFEENDKVKRFQFCGLNIYVYLFLYTDDKNKLPDKYKKYWYDNPKAIFDVTSKTPSQN
ncbi:MAG: DEAD/DEAH box helicase family protein [Thermoplasmata archaeon]